MSPANNVDSGEDWIKGSAGDSTIFSNGEIIFTLVEAKTDVDFKDVVECRIEEAIARMQENRIVRVESEVRCDKSEGLARPYAGVAGDRDSGIWMRKRTAMRGRLAVFRDARSGEETEASPVVDSVFER